MPSVSQGTVWTMNRLRRSMQALAKRQGAGLGIGFLGDARVCDGVFAEGVKRAIDPAGKGVLARDLGYYFGGYFADLRQELVEKRRSWTPCSSTKVLRRNCCAR